MYKIKLLKWNTRQQHLILVKISYFIVILEVFQRKAISLIVNGFCKEVFKKLPMEFAMEAQKLMELTLEDSVG